MEILNLQEVPRLCFVGVAWNLLTPYILKGSTKPPAVELFEAEQPNYKTYQKLLFSNTYSKRHNKHIYLVYMEVLPPLLWLKDSNQETIYLILRCMLIMSTVKFKHPCWS